MASNKKWFKRAIRSLTAGETQLWNLIKEKLPVERVEMLESQFFGNATETETLVEEVPVVEEKVNKTKTKKTTTTKKSPRKTTTKKSTTKKNTRTKKSKETQDG